MKYKDNSLLWIASAAVVGAVIGSIFFGQVESMLFSLIKLIYLKPFLFLLIALIAIAAFAGITYLEKIETTRTETALSEDQKRQLRVEIEHEISQKRADLTRLQETIKTKRQDLLKVSMRIYQELDTFQQNQVNFICFIDQVSDLLSRRSEKLQKQLPDNPISVEKIQHRDYKLQEELNSVLKEIGKCFPDMIGSLPEPRQSPLQVIRATDNLEVLRLEAEQEHAQRVAEYKSVKLPIGASKTR